MHRSAESRHLGLKQIGANQQPLADNGVIYRLKRPLIEAALIRSATFRSAQHPRQPDTNAGAIGMQEERTGTVGGAVI